MYKIVLFLLITINLSAQNAKNVGWHIQEIHYPEIQLPTDYKTYKTIVNTNNDNIKLVTNTKQTSASFKNVNISNSVSNLINLIGFTRSENPDFILEFTDLGVKHIISVKEKTSGYGENQKKEYTGILELSSTIKLVVKDKNNEILYDKIFNKTYESERAGVYNNSSIKSKEIALSEIKKLYENKIKEYRTHKNLNISEDVIREISNSLKSLFSAYYEKKRINLFRIKKEEKFGIKKQ